MRAQVVPIRDSLEAASEWAASGGGHYRLGGEFEALDEVLQGLHRARMHVIAARPAMGKSTLAGCASASLAMAGHSVLYVTIEMDPGEVVGRVAVGLAKVSLKHLRGEGRRADAWARFAKAQGFLGELDIDFVDGGATMREIEALIEERDARGQPTDVLVIDYVQLMPGAGQSARERVESLSQGLALMSREREICSIVVAQINRGAEARSNGRPMMSDLKDSGALEQDAYMVLLLYRAAYYMEAAGVDWTLECDWHPDKVDVIVAKNRNGPTGAVPMRWIRPQFRYEAWGEDE